MTNIFNADAPPPAPRNALFDEACRSLRAGILLRAGAQCSLMFTGAKPREGKSTVVAHLAASLASTTTVVVVDADLRRPRQHELFRQDNRRGFSDYLEGTARLEDVTHAVSGALSVIPSGPVPRDPVALLGSDRLRDAIPELHKKFRFVLIDAPPVLAVADPTLVGRHVSGVMLVLKFGDVTVTEANLAKTRLEAAGANLWGSVLNEFPVDEELGYHPYVKEYTKSVAVLHPTGDPA